MCKEGEHALLCPNEKVPCLNAAFGCPIIMPRSWQAGHLQVCPASVVCCSMEWIRWPADEAYANTHPDIHAHTHTLHENLLKEQKAGEQLDLAMALDDQRHLYARMKMKTLYPEMIVKVEGEEEEKKEDKKNKKTEDWATVRLCNGASTLCTAADDGWSEDRPYHILSGNWIFWTNPKCYFYFTYFTCYKITITCFSSLLPSLSTPGVPETAVTDLSDFSLEKEEGDVGVEEPGGDISSDRYNRYERMFNMDKGGCNVDTKSSRGREGKEWNHWMELEEQSCREKKERRDAEELMGALQDPGAPEGPRGTEANRNATGITGMAPWQDGVLQRMAKEVTPQEFNMYLVHHGRMLLTFGQMDACTPREKDFVYGNIEPIPVQTLYSFKVRVAGRSEDCIDFTHNVKNKGKQKLDAVLLIFFSLRHMHVHVHTDTNTYIHKSL